MGYGYDSFGHSRMVILDIDNIAGHTAGHIPGAHLLAADENGLWERRDNGLIITPGQVPGRARIDEIINRTGIDGTAVVVLTGRDLSVVGRAYFTFRYWGFAREDLKVLAGGKSHYAAAGFPLSKAAVPPVEPCGITVCSRNPAASIPVVRASLHELMDTVSEDSSSTVIIDGRSQEVFHGTPAHPTAPADISMMVSFEGHIHSGVNLPAFHLFVGQDTRQPLLPREELEAAMRSVGAGPDSLAYVYGDREESGAALFLILDAVLRWPVKLYDGGWQQWGMLAGGSSRGGLPPDSKWRTDVAGFSDHVTYNVPPGDGYAITVPALTDIFVGRADKINRDDSSACGLQNNDTKILAPGY